MANYKYPNKMNYCQYIQQKNFGCGFKNIERGLLTVFIYLKETLFEILIFFQAHQFPS